jgi:hypothetical protein
MTEMKCLCEIYITAEPNTNMITEEAYAPYLSKITFDSKKPETENVGIKHDFMSVLLLICHNRYAIQSHFSFRSFVMLLKEKRDLMHELESIIKSVEVPKNSIYFSL